MLRDRDGGGCGPGAVMIVGFLALALFFFVNELGSPLDWFTRPPPAVEPRGPAIIKQIRSVNRIETQSYLVDGIYKVGHETGPASNFLYEDVVVLGARAEIIAGIDLAKLKDSDVVVEGDSVRITLPPSEILFVKLDNNATRIFDRERGWLVGLGIVSSDNELERDARLFAEQQLLADACERGILQQAASEGKLVMERLMRALKLTPTVIVGAGQCVAPDLSAQPTQTMPSRQGTVSPSSSPQPTTGGGGLTGTVVVVTPAAP